MSQPVIVESAATGEEIEAIIAQRLVPAIADLDRSKVMLSLLTFFFVLMKPDLTPKELKDGVRGASQWICLFLSEQDVDDSKPVDKNKLN
jgi:hypothetical protein